MDLHRPSSSNASVESKLSLKNDINPAFKYLGIPKSWLKTKSFSNFKLPSRNTSAFLLLSTSLISLYFYDREQCKRIRQKYINQVQHISQEPIPDSETSLKWMPRKLNVYGARVPEDVEVDRAAQWFKKYVKPILVAAAIDYTIHDGISPGGLGRKIAADIRDQRVIQAAQEKDGFKQSPLSPGMPGYRQWHAEQNKLEGGTLILGRATLKEYLWGLQQGYKQHIPLDTLDDDERFARELEEQGVFDDPPSSEHLTSNQDLMMPQGLRSVQEGLGVDGTGTDDPFNDVLPHSTHSVVSEKPSRFFGLFSRSQPAPITPLLPTEPLQKTLAPIPIPPQPPLLLVPFDHPIGMKWWPLKLFRFFHRRAQAETGGQTALKLIESQRRPIQPPIDFTGINEWPKSSQMVDQPDFSVKLTKSPDLDFLAPEAEEHLRASYKKAASKILEEQELFRNELRSRLLKARQASNDLENKSTSNSNNGLNESQLRQEAFQKEKKWRNDLEGWNIVRKGSGVCWDPDMEHTLELYVSKENI
ncbi:hypothetical protein O181_059407 [Austropuccinia psidii MF-1]|uniref:Mitochondrial import inner membrane translocase subunit TIM54 n=1 Tax=Austropuccinia psidii MF-1 TaxID=1389203 RepID=A0A9Q3ELK8_9BASI|nr:hypothetical protein [Austropuccinia psidii MF-1]